MRVPPLRQSAGAPVMWWVSVDQAALTWSGTPSWYATWPTLHRAFCGTCGANLASVADGAPTISLTGTSLDDRAGAELAPYGFSFRD